MFDHPVEQISWKICINVTYKYCINYKNESEIFRSSTFNFFLHFVFFLLEHRSSSISFMYHVYWICCMLCYIYFMYIDTNWSSTKNLYHFLQCIVTKAALREKSEWHVLCFWINNVTMMTLKEIMKNGA